MYPSKVRRDRCVQLLVAGFLLMLLSGCAGDRQMDELNLRARFHVPAEARLVSLDGGPYEYGFTGREGLRLAGVFEFTDQQFQEYLKRTEEPAVWKPVPFRRRSPETEAEYTEPSSTWTPLPLPEWLFQSHEHPISAEWASALKQIQSGTYWCTVNEFHHDQRPFYFKRYACSEKPYFEGYAFTLGVVDPAAKRLYAIYDM